ncbi:MAG: hypothetical protein ACYDHH_12480 [Solirubrobacteraceae bacterium]
MSLSFLFIQFEFTHALGPHAGRYVVDAGVVGDVPADEPSIGEDQQERGGSQAPALDARNQQLAGVTRGVGGADVLVVGVLGTPAGKVRVLRRARPVKAGAAPDEVPLSLLTFVKGTEPLGDGGEAAALLDAIRLSAVEQQRWVAVGLRVINVAVRAYRTGAPDPYAIDVTRRDARRIRIGYGGTDEVQNGRWHDAIELAPAVQPRRKLVERLRPAEAVAAVLAGKADVLEAEDLLLRALIDLDHRRTRAAALQVAAATRLLPSELGSRPATDALDFDSLAPRAQQAEELAGAAATGPLDAHQLHELESIIDAVEELLIAWRYERVAD